MRGSLFAGVVCLALGVSALACSSEESGGGGKGGSAGAGGSGGGTGGSGGSTQCGPTPLGFPGTCEGGAPEQCCADTLPVMAVRDSSDALVPPDWSCITGGGGAAGAAGAAGSAGSAGSAGDAGPLQNKFEVEDFISGKGVADIEVELYEGEGIIDKTPFHVDFTKGVEHHTNDDTLNVGELWFPHPAAPLLSYRVKEKPGVAKEFLGFGELVPPPPGLVGGSTLSPTSYEQLSQFAVPLVGWEPPPDRAIMTGPIRDCAGDDVGGARVRFFDEATGDEIVPGTCETDVRYIYFDSQYPNPKCSYTDYRQSLWVIANSPTNSAGAEKGHKYRVEYWGRLNASQTEPVKFAEKSVEIFQNTVNVHQIRPNVQQ